MINSSVFRFLKQLKANNERLWFVRHRAEYNQARTNVLGTVDQIIAGIARFDPPIIEQAPEDCLFRICRDFRFSPETPYKNNFGAFITDRGRNVDRAGYYLHVEPGACFLGGGLYTPPAPKLKAVRQAILQDGQSLRRIISRWKFVKLFGKTLPGRRLKTGPRDIPRDHPDIDLLQLTSFAVDTGLKDAQVQKKNFVGYAIGVFETLHEYVAWLNHALDTYETRQSA